MSDADKTTSADARRLRLLQHLLHERGYVRDRRGFWVAPDVIGIKPEMLREDEDGEDE